MNTKLKFLACALAIGLIGSATAAEKKYGPGVSDTEIKLGQTVPYSGPASAFGSYGRTVVGYFNMLNEQGGINGRKVQLISLDNAFSPPKALEQTRKLVESDGVLADVGTVGTTPNVAIQKYLNQNKVPHIFISAGGKRFVDPKNFPWSVPMYPGFEMEGRTFGEYIVKTKPDAKIAVLYQNDDYGKDFLTGLKAALDGKKAKVVSELAYEITQPTVDSEIVRLKDSGADVLMYFSTPKFTAQGLRKVKEMNWAPLQFLVSPTNSIQTVLKPAGFENAQGIFTTQFSKQAGDPAWADDPEVKEYGFWLSMPQYLIMGLMLGLISILDDGIELALGIHFINNALTALLVTHEASALQTDALFLLNDLDPVASLISISVASILVILILQRIYKWDFGIMNRKVAAVPPPTPPVEVETIGQSPAT